MIISHILLLIFAFWEIDFPNAREGNYIGIEERCYTDEKGKKKCEDENDKKAKWFYLTELLIKDDSVFIEQSSITIRKQDTLSSESDGKFIYKGKIKKAGQEFIAITKLSYCDYCVTEVVNVKSGKIEKEITQREWTIKPVNKGILVNNRLYKKL